MQKKVRNHMKKIEKKRGKRRILYVFIAICAVLVAGIVSWQLTVPGVAWSRDAKCGMEEHKHTEACYENEYSCIHEESEEHVHTDDCYTDQQTLICGMEDHTHEVLCYSDAEADVETEADWMYSFANAELTGDWNQNAAAIARTQIGYKESEANFILAEGDVPKGYTRYGVWAGDTYGDWSTFFAAFCLHYAGVPSDAFPVDYDLNQWVDALAASGYYRNPAEVNPDVGDLVIMSKQGRETGSQIGIISGVEEKDGAAQNIYVIEGNLDNEVKEIQYAADDAEIIGYGMLSSAEDIYKVIETKEPLGGKEQAEGEAAVKEETRGIQPEAAQEAGTIDQKVTLDVTAKDLGNGSEAGTGVNGQILYANVDVTNSNPTDAAPSAARIYIGDLPEGVSLAGFENGIMNVEYQSNTTSESFQVKLVVREDGTPDYVEFAPPTGTTVHFELQFNSKNGIMDKTSVVTLTPEITGKAENDILSDPAQLTWTGENVWRNLQKKVDQTVLGVNGPDNSVEGKLNYTITAEEQNADGANDVGSIWTKEVQITDTLTLPEGLAFPEGAKVSSDGTKIVSEKGEDIFYFTDLQGGMINSLVLDEKTVTYKVTVLNQHLKDGVPEREQDHLKVRLTLDASRLKLRDHYAETSTEEQIAADKIINGADIKTIAYKGPDSYEDHKEAETKLQVNKGFELSKHADRTQVKPGETMEYTISIQNTGAVPLKEKDENGKINYVTDQLPEYLVLTETQIKALESKGAAYDKAKHTISWNPGMIGVNKSAELKFFVNVADAQAMKDLADGTEITNKADYLGKDSSTTVTYKKPSINIKKTHEGGKDTVVNGDLVTYTVTVENPEDFDSYTQTIKDVLPAGLEFQHMVASSGEKVSKDGAKFQTAATLNAGGTHDVTLRVNGQNLTWELGTLAAREKVILTYVCKVNTDKLQGNETLLTNEVTAEGSGADSDQIKVKYPLSIDKSLTGDKEGETYEDGRELKYKISIQNAPGNEASDKDDLQLVDKLPYGMLPSQCDLYVAKQGVTAVTSVDDLARSALTWKQFVSNLNYPREYYTVINGEAVKADTHWTSDRTRGVQLTWNIGNMKPGEKMEKTYFVKIFLTDQDKELGTKVPFRNTATLGGQSDSVTIYGRKEVGSLSLQKIIAGEVRLSGLTQEQKAEIQFRVTMADEKTGAPILDENGKPQYQRDFTLNDFTVKAGDAFLELKGLKYGMYKVEEVKAGDFPDYRTTVTVNGEVGNSADVTLNSKDHTEKIVFENDYALQKAAKVDIQKSVWSITDQPNDRIVNELKDKEIFKKKNKNTNYVIYNIAITNTGSEPVRLSEMVDHMTDGLEYVGIRSALDNKNASAFGKEIITAQSSLKNWTTLKSNRIATDKIKETAADKEKQKVTFQIGGATGYNLKAGKTISFFLMCKVDGNATLDVPLTNTVDLIVDPAVEHGKDPDTVMMKGTRDDTRQNYGTGADQGVNGETGMRTISAAVTVTPTDVIVPGITKEAESYIPEGKEVINAVKFKEKDNIQPNVTVKWNVTLYNDGTLPIDGYDIKDSIMPPFHIVSAEEAKKLGFTDGEGVFALNIYDANDALTQTADLSKQVWETVKDNETSAFIISIDDSRYQIPAGGKAVLTVYTRNTTFANKIYENTAKFLPHDIEFDANRVRRGQLVSDANDVYIGVKASDSVYALGDYGSFSWKTIEDAQDGTNKGWGYKGQENKNFITLDGDRRTVVYTNNIENVSKNPFKNMVIVDLMPYEGDHGVINSTEQRDSKFTVAFGVADQLKLYVTDADEKLLRELNQTTDYTIEFSSQDLFTEGDLDGDSSEQWHKDWKKGDRSFRIKMSGEFRLEPEQILVMQYSGEIGEDANPGELAWNSFGYRYTATSGARDTVLTAEPPKVGVQIRKQSTIEKQVVDASGQSLGYDADKSFTFKLYEGETADEAHYLTEFVLHQGEAVSLDTIKKANGSNAFEDGKKYTVTEVTGDGYELAGIGIKGESLSPENKYTFTYYHNTDSISIVVKNREIGYELPKTGGTGTMGYTLGGAMLMLLACLLYIGKCFLYNRKTLHADEAQQ